VLHGDQARLLGFDASEHPIASAPCRTRPACRRDRLRLPSRRKPYREGMGGMRAWVIVRAAS